MNKNKIYGHTELALLYFKHIQPKSASTQLARWLRRDEELWEELLLAGQLEIIIDHLGEPENWNIK